MATNIAFKNNILIVCNIINVIYHVPQIIKTYRTKSVKDFDPYYLFLGNLHSLCWVMYSISDNNYLMLFNSCVTVFSISFVSYYKITSYISDYYNKKNLSKLDINIENSDTNTNTNTNTNNNKIIIVNNGE
jgi:uncharacterized protein with PQ loop repeat